MLKEKIVIFLDRDGVINEYPGDHRYVTSWQEFKFIPGSIDAIKSFKEKGFYVVVISNQAGVAKKIFSKKALEEITNNMVKEFSKNKIYLDGIYYCLHQDLDNCDCRKPKIGLLEKAISDLKINSAKYFFIGDSFIDMETAKNFGAISILVLSGKESLNNKKNWKFMPDYIFNNLFEASIFLNNL